MFALYSDRSPRTLEQEHMFGFFLLKADQLGARQVPRGYLSVALDRSTCAKAKPCSHPRASWQAPQTCLRNLHPEV